MGYEGFLDWAGGLRIAAARSFGRKTDDYVSRVKEVTETTAFLQEVFIQMRKIIRSKLVLILIVICAAGWFIYGIPLIAAIILVVLRIWADKKDQKETESLKEELEQAKAALNAPIFLEYEQAAGNRDHLYAEVERLQTLVPELTEYTQLKREINFQNAEIQENNKTIDALMKRISELRDEKEKLDKQVCIQINKLERSRELYKSMQYVIESFPEHGQILDTTDNETLDFLAPGVMLQLHCMDNRDLRKAYKENDRQIDRVFMAYAARYTTKTNRAIYELMVIALRSELQNILYNLKYEKLEKSVEDIRSITAKYLKIAGEGNQNISGTLTRFIGEIEYLFINAAKIEYNYYVKKEQMKQEQAALREQMKQEAEERKALLEEQRKVEREEQKYQDEIRKLEEKAADASEDELKRLKKRILDLQSQLADVAVKKEEILQLQNGKAGTVYIISNMGSFGENIFKVGMTRRSEPMERIKELGNASVPFQFDVHSFIFSDNAVDLERKMHEMLGEKRVNRVNLRKEFFRVSLDEIEKLVYEIEPTANFNRTMLAEEYRQSISSDFNYTSDYIGGEETEEE